MVNFYVSGMNLSKGCKCEVVLCLWLCCYLLLAAGQNGVTAPTEGIFFLLLLLFHDLHVFYDSQSHLTNDGLIVYVHIYYAKHNI